MPLTQHRGLIEINAPSVMLRDNVTLETVTSVDGVAALRACYEHLLEVTGNTLPFALPDWHLAWCRHFLNCNPRIRDELHFCVLRNSLGVCVAIVPFVIS